MNERIEKLVRQADACYIPRYDMWQMDTETLEKFAELIVRECIDIAVDCDVIEYNDFRQGVAQEIKKHFGVE